MNSPTSFKPLTSRFPLRGGRRAILIAAAADGDLRPDARRSRVAEGITLCTSRQPMPTCADGGFRQQAGTRSRNLAEVTWAFDATGD